MSGPCSPWIGEDEELVSCGCPDGPQTVVQASIVAATEILYNLSGRRYTGECSERRRPCRAAAACGCASFHLCSCITGDTIVLPRRNVRAVTEVLIDGAAFADFQFYKPNWIVRSDGEAWPCCQDLTEALTEEGTWSVEYTFGTDPPEAGKNAARVLTTELVKACTQDTTCRIPVGAVSLTRRGVTYDLSEQEGRTGITEVDLWLSSVNPEKRRRRASITSPDDIRWVPDPVVGS